MKVGVYARVSMSEGIKGTTDDPEPFSSPGRSNEHGKSDKESI